MKYLLFITLFVSMNVESYVPRADWKTNKSCHKDLRTNDNYCFEIIELKNNNGSNAVLLLPGLLHNAHIFDLDPENNISLARYIQKTFNANVYILNYRFVGSATPSQKTNLDDLAREDIPNAIDYVFNKEKKKIFLIGHSQGGITGNLSLSGIDLCGKASCFHKETAQLRQSKVKAFGIFAGNNKLHFLDKDNPLLTAAKMSKHLAPVIKKLDIIDIESFSQIFQKAGQFNIWSSLTISNLVTPETRQHLFGRSFQSTTSPILLQFLDGVLSKDLKTQNGISFPSQSKNIKIPVFHQVYSEDPFAMPKETKQDTFDAIGSTNKKFSIIENLSHEDFLLHPKLHQLTKPMFIFFNSL